MAGMNFQTRSSINVRNCSGAECPGFFADETESADEMLKYAPKAGIINLSYMQEKRNSSN